ncbi:hypothetical protein LINPERHAP1_LOCUS21081, partial [Linum perenne]
HFSLKAHWQRFLVSIALDSVIPSRYSPAKTRQSSFVNSEPLPTYSNSKVSCNRRRWITNSRQILVRWETIKVIKQRFETSLCGEADKQRC